PKVADPWGKSLKLAGRTPAELVALLDDPRPKVRDAVVELLGKRGTKAIPQLAGVLKPEARRSAQARRNAVWALCRIAGPEARAAPRVALWDRDAGVRHAAAHAAGVERDAFAMKALMKIAVEDELPLRLKAAEGLGRLGKTEAVPALLDCVRKGG